MDFIHLVKKLNNVKLLSFVLIIPLILFLKAKQNTNIIIGLVVPLLMLLGVYLAKRPSSVYLVDFACYKPVKERKMPKETFMKKMEECGVFEENTIEFQERIIRKSGLGDETSLPEALTFEKHLNLFLEDARLEAETVIFGALDDLFAKTNVEPNVVDILIVNCSLFNPTPSLSAMIVNHYNLRNNIKCFNLGGMGCSAGVISVNLAKDILNANPDSCAVVVSTENLTLNWYRGNDRSMLLSNCIFRMGGAAILLSNKFSDRTRSKYKLVHTVRTHSGAKDKSYNCAFQKEDEKGHVGVSLSKELMKVAGEALKMNLTELGPLVLPFSEKLMFMISLFRKSSNYVPNFKLAFEHLCIHAGGKSVLDVVQKNLQLSEWHMEPSRSTLHRFGNTSSSSLWYELAYIEAKGRVSKGDRVCQIAFGAGFKCNTAVWRACRDIPVLLLHDDWTGNPWDDSVNNYPIDFSAI